MSQFIEMFGTIDEPKVEVKKLIDVVLSSGQYGSNTSATDYQEGKPRYIRITDINDDGSLNDDIKTAEVIEDKYRLIPGDIVFARTGATVGKTYMHETGNAIYAGYLIKYQMNESKMKPAFMKAFTHSKTYYNWVANSQKVGAQPNISAAQYDNMPVLVPQIEKQEEFLAICHQADKSGFDGRKSQFIEMFTDKGYPLTMIKSFADVSTGGTPSKAHPEYWNGDKPWVSAEDMKSKYVYDTCEKVTEAGYAACKIIPVDTLMYVCRGSIGVMAINKIECATNQSICRATCHNNVCNVEFLYHALMYQRDNIKKKGTGTSFKSLNQTTFSELEIELPPYDEQMKFVTIAEQSDKSGSVLQHMIAC